MRTTSNPPIGGQVDAFMDGASARTSDPATSKQAAATLTITNIRASQLRVLQLFRVYGDMDDRTLRKVATAEGFKISDSGLRSRRSELAKPNEERLTAIVEEMGDGVGLAMTHEQAREQARQQLRREGFRSPLWDTGRRVEYEQGRQGIVWGLAV